MKRKKRPRRSSTGVFQFYCILPVMSRFVRFLEFFENHL
uniref:Uncharacterized protein n=1 Tax=Rhizophora mucronata TaxID=61149 RepID=A0A2P2IYY1_RHIMU